jgi:hypothetical protein
MLSIKTRRESYGTIIDIRDTMRDYSTCAKPEDDPIEHLRNLARQERHKAERCARLAAFLDEAAAAMEKPNA